VNHPIRREIIHEYAHAYAHMHSRSLTFPVDYQKFMRSSISKASKSSKLAARGRDLWDSLGCCNG